jgi:cytoskeletal protein RodZ
MVRAGERLREERERKGLTLDEVAKATKIKPSFLVAIEKGEYQKLPLGTYTHGFVGNYAKFLKLPEREILAIFKREYDEEKILKIIPDGLAKQEDFPLHKFRLSQALKILPLIFLALLAYIIFQYRAAIFDPALTVSYPLNNSVISSQTITVTGKTDPNVTVFVNSEVASLDKEGNFNKTINVFPGKTKIIIKSVNNFKKTTILERQVEVKMTY